MVVDSVQVKHTPFSRPCGTCEHLNEIKRTVVSKSEAGKGEVLAVSVAPVTPFGLLELQPAATSRYDTKKGTICTLMSGTLHLVSSRTIVLLSKAYLAGAGSTLATCQQGRVASAGKLLARSGQAACFASSEVDLLSASIGTCRRSGCRFEAGIVISSIPS
jgi:hypothetical protein